MLIALELVPGTGGVFDVDVDGDRIFFKKMIGRYPEPEDVLPLLRERIGPEVALVQASSPCRTPASTTTRPSRATVQPRIGRSKWPAV